LAVKASGLSASAYGLIYAVNPATVILAQPLAMRLVDRLPAVPTMAISSLIIGVGFWLTSFAKTIPMYAVTVLVWTVGEIGFNAVEPALIAEIAPPDMRGRYNGLIGTAFGASALLGPLAGTWLYGMSPNVLWLACLAAGAASAAVTLALGPAIARRQRVVRAAAATPSEAAPPSAAPLA
jgi:MFS family permease